MEVEEVVEAEEVEGEDSLLEGEVVEVDVVGSPLEVVEVVVEVDGEAVVAEGVAEEWEAGRKLSSSLTDTPGSSLPEGRRMPW